MKLRTSIRWHSRAGQGAVSAANFLAIACADLGLQVQSFPDFGAEKRGAPVQVFNRIADQEKRLDDPAHLMAVDLVVLLDPTLVGHELDYDDVLQNLKSAGTLIINTDQNGKTGFHQKFDGKIFHLNASQIAQETIGRNIPNVAMMGGLINVLGLQKESVRSSLFRDLSAVFSQKIVEKNLEAFDLGFEKIDMIRKV